MVKMPDCHTILVKTKAIVITHFLPISFAIAIIIAMTAPAAGVAVASVTILDDIHIIAWINMMIVFFISGLVLNTDDIKEAWKQKFGFSYGLLAILAITPCLGFAIREIPLTPPEYTQGLTLFSAVPTTLGVGMSLVASCRGNVALALLLTVITNMVGCATVPLWLKALFPSSSSSDTSSTDSSSTDGTDSGLDEVSVDVLALFVRLTITILVPSVLGKAARELIPGAKGFVKRWKVALSLFSTFNLAFIVWQTLSGAQHIIVSTPFVETLYAILLAIAQHLIYLVLNFFVVVYIMKMSPPEAIATGIMGSQKSAPVAVTVINNLQATTTQKGLLAVPCICGQIFQIFIGSALVPFFAWRVRKWEEKELEKKGAVALETVVSSKRRSKLGGGGNGSHSSSITIEGEVFDTDSVVVDTEEEGIDPVVENGTTTAVNGNGIEKKALDVLHSTTGDVESGIGR